jgi:hypothetical protein
MMIQHKVSSDLLWWGYSVEHGWVMLDRKWNGIGNAELWLIRCSDGYIYSEIKSRWNSKSYYLGAEYVIDSAPTNIKQSVIEEFNNAQSKETFYIESLSKKCNEVIEEIFNKKRVEFLKNLEINDSGSSQPNSKSCRHTNCFACKKFLKSSNSLQCNSCGWLICKSCAACGCGYIS